MAQPRDQLSQEKFGCSICRELLKDPVTIPCGHSYCMSCIKHRWDKEEIYSCFQCRKTFEPRPALNISIVLAEIMKERKKTELERPQSHFEVVPPKKQKLDEASTKLQICPHPSEKVYCRTDHQCICYTCAFELHRGHDTDKVANEMAERQKELRGTRQNNKERIENGEKYEKLLQKEVEDINRSANKALWNCEMMSTELNLSLKKNVDVKQQINEHRKSEVSRAKELQEKLHQELAELRKRDADLERLSHTKDNIQFLHDYFSLSNISKSSILPGINTRHLQHFDDVTKTVSEARVKLNEAWKRISGEVIKVDVLLPQDPKFKMDPNTASMKMVLSEENRKATSVQDEQSYPSQPGRFMDRPQVLSSKGVTSGRHYWEVQWSGLGVTVAIAYKDISRTGEESIFGNNDKSWALECVTKVTGNYANFKHNCKKEESKRISKETSISGPQFSRVGVYLDYTAGILSFYSVSETTTLLHKEQITFTQPVYAGLGVYYKGSTAEFCDKTRVRVD